MAIEPVDYPFGTPTTEDAFRVRLPGETLFVKIIRSFRHWPMLHALPPDLAEQAMASGLWRYEADLYMSEVGALLPPGMRLPRVHHVADLDDDRIAIVMENVEVTDRPWDADRFARAARLLARLNARLTRADALPASASRVPGFMTDVHYRGRLQIADLPMLADDRTWAHPLMAPHGELRSTLARLADDLPAVMAELCDLPQALIHGDASPQNLLTTEDGTFVVIDWTMGGMAAVGTDLAQLLIGLTHAGLVPVTDLPGLRTRVIDAYTAGLADEGFPAGREAVCRGLDGGLLLRSAFTALPLTRLHEPLTDELAGLIEARLALTAYLCELGSGLVKHGPRSTVVSC
jgi:hypothetical protein